MNPLTGLTDYLRRVERRLRLLAFIKGAAITAAAALIFTVLAVLLANAFAFSNPSVASARVLLFVALALALGIGLVVPLLRLNRRNAARETERKFPAFQERLLTFTERAHTNPDDPFLPLLAADTLEVTHQAEPAHVAGRNRILSFLAGAAGSLAVLIWLGTSGPGFLGYGTSLLWGGLPKGDLAPYYDISVAPGNRTVRRLADQLIGAQLKGFQAQRVRMFAKYASSSKWEQADMRPQLRGTGYEFLIAGVPESLDYYVEAGGVRSQQYHLKVVDLPGIKKLKVTYHFPGWTGMKDKIEDPGGDLRAVEGTDADVAVETDRPLVNGALLFDDGTKVPLRSGENGLRIATVPIRKDGMYHIAAIDQGEDVRLSPDYFIEAEKDEPPTVRITRPQRDARVNPIEEVTVTVEGQDDFGLNELSLHYSVNGDAEKTVSLLKGKGSKTASGSTTIALEDFRLSPGDLVSLYATSRDAHSIARTDMLFVQAEPFERRYSQSQEGGMGGAAGDQDDNKISERQKEIIAATWNQIKDTSGDKAAAAENAGFLSGVQSKLRDQAHSLSDRMKARQLGGSSEEFKTFTADMDEAVKAMGPASDKLRGSQWQNALAPEEKALQHLLRAEAVMRDIKVAFGNRGAGGGGGGSGADRDLQSLFDLELDTEKNQYESGQSSASKDQRQRAIDEALQKLEQLARRQQELAEQQRRNQQVSQQRWQQEMLRREAEELQRKMEQLSRNQQRQPQSGQPQSGQQQSGPSSSQSARQSSQGGQMSSQQLQRAIEQLRQAQQDMRQSTSTQSEADSRRAAERLKEARDLLSGLRQQQAAGSVDDLARQAEDLANREQESNAKMRRAFGMPGQQQGQGVTPQQTEELAREKEQLANDYQRLEAGMGTAARDMRATNRQLSSKLRDALGQVQQNEINNRLRLSADWLRTDRGPQATMRDATTTQALNNLRDQLREMQKSLGEGQQGAGDKDRQGLEQALAQAESLRKEMERGMRGQRQGQQPGQQKGTQRGQAQGQSGEQPGQEPGQQQGQSQSAQAGEGQSGQIGPRSNGPQYGLLPSLGPTFGDSGDFLQNYRHTLRELENNPQIGKDLRDTIQNLYRLDPRLSPGNPELMNRIESQMLTGVEQIELQLRRQLDDQGGAVRSGSAEPVPQGYADAVAEYFRRLSKEK
ncbi:MAG TPA: hypothetical protein VN924_29345 [Bryobacteraceae bacterium]|nr:hypothetical protein [Bryobacteraceae bacterium]